eukprot:TRINITY_DN2087_c1_g1_i1.p1 TRINITY_DN2087_c1_g1~~TRINITY_DN2087_c1_g1_i1.p1  ORF type:complete len:146 (+),score=7.75 TRINITY_DN2087_c1_g1_i1:294-731(+)
MIIRFISIFAGVICIMHYFKWSIELDESHHIIGFLLVIGMFLQGILGFVANKMWKEDRESVPFFPDMLHWLLGRTLFFGALINIYLGMEMDAICWNAWYYTAYSFFVAFIIGYLCVHNDFTPHHPASTKTINDHRDHYHKYGEIK